MVKEQMHKSGADRVWIGAKHNYKRAVDESIGYGKVESGRSME